MKTTVLHVNAVFVALCVLFVVVSGATVTNSLAVPAAPILTGLLSSAGHQHAGEAVGLLVVILVLWVWIAMKTGPARRLAWFPLIAVVAEIGLGHGAGKSAPLVSLAHAFMAPVLLSTVAALALATSLAWRRAPVMIQDKGWPPMRGLALTTLVFVVLQVAMGAAFRHGVLGVMPHIIGALVVAVLILTKVICLTQMSGKGLLKPAAITLLVMVGVQIFLGLTVVSMSDRAMAQLAGLIFSAVHVALGSATLAASVVVTMEARRSVLPAPPKP